METRGEVSIEGMDVNTIRWAVRCSGRSSQTGKPCQRWSIRGGYVCPSHGGRAPQVRAKARERLIERTAAAFLISFERQGW